MDNNPVTMSEEFVVVIDTDCEVFDFSAELAVYCTGVCNENNDGQDMVELFEKDYPDNPFAEMLMEAERNSVMTAYTPWPSKKYRRNEDDEIAVVTEENKEEYIYPLGYSVGIYFWEKPSDELIDIIKKRSLDFAQNVWPTLGKRSKVIKVEGFRLIVFTKTGQEFPL